MAKQIAKLLKTDVMADIDMPAIAQFLQSQGRRGDSILAHINPKEAALLQRMGGAATPNPVTGLPEFYYERPNRYEEPYGAGAGSNSKTRSSGRTMEIYDEPIVEYKAAPNASPLVNMPDPDGSPADGSFSFSTGRNNLSGYLEYDPRRLSREPMFTGAGNLDAPVIETQFDPRMGFGGRFKFAAKLLGGKPPP